MVGVIAMLSAISLDDQPALDTCEISDAAADRFLSSEFESAEPPIGEVMPKTTFRIGSLTPQPPRMRVDLADSRHGRFLEEGKPSPNPLP